MNREEVPIIFLTPHQENMEKPPLGALESMKFYYPPYHHQSAGPLSQTLAFLSAPIIPSSLCIQNLSKPTHKLECKMSHKCTYRDD